MTLLVKDYTDIELCIEQTMPRGPRPPRSHPRRLRQDLVRAVRGPPWLFRAGGLPCQAIGRGGRGGGGRPGLPALFGALFACGYADKQTLREKRERGEGTSSACNEVPCSKRSMLRDSLEY